MALPSSGFLALPTNLPLALTSFVAHYLAGRVHERDALGREPDSPPAGQCGLDDTAYVLYTSGSTGTPKGVAVAHRGIHNRIAWGQDTYPLQAADRVLQKTPCSFDVSVWEFFWPLTAGATLVLAAPGGHRDPHYLHRLITDEGITTMHFVPTMLSAFLGAITPGLSATEYLPPKRSMAGPHHVFASLETPRLSNPQTKSILWIARFRTEVFE